MPTGKTILNVDGEDFIEVDNAFRCIGIGSHLTISFHWKDIELLTEDIVIENCLLTKIYCKKLYEIVKPDLRNMEVTAPPKRGLLKRISSFGTLIETILPKRHLK